MEIIIATNNQGKVREFKNRLTGIDVYSLKDKGIEIEVEEDGKTFEENAIKKARTVADLTGVLTMADDSGLEVFALDNAPGIYSARYGGPDLDDKGRYIKVLEDMKGKTDRGARFVSVIALCFPNGTDITLRGECYGEILKEPSGEGGFGYDPVFFYPPLNKSFGVLSLDEKNKISHRARALDKLERFFKKENCVIENDKLRAEISFKGAELVALLDKKTGRQLMNTDKKSWDFVSPVLFPVLGKFDEGYTFEGKKYCIGNHGFTRTSEFKLINQSEKSITFELTESESTFKSYPFKFSLLVTYTLNGTTIETVCKVKNNDDKTMLFNIGSHDAFSTTKDLENYTVTFSEKEDLKQALYMKRHEGGNLVDVYGFPEETDSFALRNGEGKTVLCFLNNPKSSWVQLNYKEKPVVRLYFDKDDTQTVGFWQAKDAEFYCIEPWTGISNTFQDTDDLAEKELVQRLKSGEEFVFSHKCEWFLD